METFITKYVTEIFEKNSNLKCKFLQLTAIWILLETFWKFWFKWKSLDLEKFRKVWHMSHMSHFFNSHKNGCVTLTRDARQSKLPTCHHTCSYHFRTPSTLSSYHHHHPAGNINCLLTRRNGHTTSKRLRSTSMMLESIRRAHNWGRVRDDEPKYIILFFF